MKAIIKLILFISTFIVCGIFTVIAGLLLFQSIASRTLKTIEPPIIFSYVLVDHQIYHGGHVNSTVWEYCIDAKLDELLYHVKEQIPDASVFERDYTFIVTKQVDNFFMQFLTRTPFYSHLPRLTVEAISSRSGECNGVWYYVTHQIENH